jgi:hypothetical protein
MGGTKGRKLTELFTGKIRVRKVNLKGSSFMTAKQRKQKKEGIMQIIVICNNHQIHWKAPYISSSFRRWPLNPFSIIQPSSFMIN